MFRSSDRRVVSGGKNRRGISGVHRRPYADAAGTLYLSLIGQPILVYGAIRAGLSHAFERALARNVTPAVYTEDMFKTTHDAANRDTVRGAVRSDLTLSALRCGPSAR